MSFCSKRCAAFATLALLLLAVFSCFGGSAAIADTVAAHSRPYVVVTLLGAIQRGDTFVPIDKAGQVRPGELVRWTVDAHNQGSAPALAYSVSGRVPSGTEFVSGSATGEISPAITFSIDGGKAFSGQPTVQQKLADGTLTTVPAPVPAYTNVRFTWTAAIPAGESRSAYYDVRVK